MITKELIERINHLARKSRTESLSNEEKAEQARLRQQYLQGIRQQIITTLEQIKPQHEHPEQCNCGSHPKTLH